MQWHSLSEFLAMGGYAFYVWGSFGATALVMGVESLRIRRRRRQVMAQLRDELEAQP